MSAAQEVLTRIAEREIAALKESSMIPGADAGHPNSYIREIAASHQAQTSELVVKGLGIKWLAALMEAGLSYEVTLDRKSSVEEEDYPSNRAHYRDSAIVYCPETDLKKVLAAAARVPKKNEWKVAVYQSSSPMYIPVEGDCKESGYYAVAMYTLWQYSARTE